MKLIDCQRIRNEMLEEAKKEINKMPFAPKLAIIRVEGDDASKVYVRNKVKACEEVGIKCDVHVLPENVSYEVMQWKLQSVRLDRSVTGMMIQLPLPSHLKEYEQEFLDMISWYKDVDGLSTESTGRLWSGEECIKPATAAAIMRVLPNDLSSKYVCIINRSNLIGKPLTKMILDRNGTPFICHSKTIDLDFLTKNSDVVITAIGKSKYFDKNYFSSNKEYFDREQIWIDVSINRDENSKLCGDIDVDSIESIDVEITPVPKGIGLLTVAQLMLNVVQAFKIQHGDLLF